jgi:hypothetical protein
MAKDYEPEWAKKMEEWGKEMEAKYGRHFDRAHSHPREDGDLGDSSQQASNNKEHYTHHEHTWPGDTRPRWQRRNNPVGDIVGNIISYFIVTYVPQYFPGFFLPGFSAVRIVIILSIVVHIAVSFVLIFLPVRPLFYFGHTIMDLASLVSMVVTVTIFPFNISGSLSHIIQLVIWVIIVIVAVVTLFEFLNIFGDDSCK